MKKRIITIAFVVVFFACLFPVLSYADSYDIEKIIGAKVTPGTYRVNVTRESNDMYKVTGQDIYIKTRYCYEYVYYQDVLLEIESTSGYSIGKIHFLK